MRFWQVFAVAIFLLCGCADKAKKGAGTTVASPPALWADYRVWAEEGDSTATCLLQFYASPQKRQTLWLDAPALVAVDGVPLPGDSAGLSGAFYELRTPIDDFSGTHTIRFLDAEQRAFTDSFSFYPFRLAAELPATVTPADQVLQLEGLPDGKTVRLVLTDTSFTGMEYNELKTVRDGQVVIEGAVLRQLKSGPVTMHLSAEEERPLHSMLRGGLSVSYALSRVFELRY